MKNAVQGSDMHDQNRSQIVLAEDDPSARKLLERQLIKAGYDVVACEHGREALEAIRREGSCIVVADWMMPEMDGLELCRSVRQLSAMQVLQFVYFILLTAHSEKDQIVAGLEAGADDYLTKPYHKQELLARVRAGERIVTLQSELVNRQVELHKANAELAQLNDCLERAANTDALTQLPNRRAMFDRFAEHWALTERNGQQLGCIMFDIDRFKLINDTYGHAAGDAVLRKLAGVCKQLVRRYDMVARFGGEEFCIVCPSAPLAGVVSLAERIRTTVEETVFSYEGKVIPVTISVGAALRCAHTPDIDSLIARADAMLYNAKEQGRNQVWYVGEAGTPERFADAFVAGADYSV